MNHRRGERLVDRAAGQDLRSPADRLDRRPEPVPPGDRLRRQPELGLGAGPVPVPAAAAYRRSRPESASSGQCCHATIAMRLGESSPWPSLTRQNRESAQSHSAARDRPRSQPARMNRLGRPLGGGFYRPSEEFRLPDSTEIRPDHAIGMERWRNFERLTCHGEWQNSGGDVPVELASGDGDHGGVGDRRDPGHRR